MISQKTVLAVVLTGLAAGALAACGSTPPPKELVDARTAYQRAQAGQAAQLDPAHLHEAKVALDNAEQSFQNDPSSDRTRDLSYVAERKSELAEAQAGILGATRDKEQAIKDLEDLQSQGLATCKRSSPAPSSSSRRTNSSSRTRRRPAKRLRSARKTRWTSSRWPARSR